MLYGAADLGGQLTQAGSFLLHGGWPGPLTLATLRRAPNVASFLIYYCTLLTIYLRYYGKYLTKVGTETFSFFSSPLPSLVSKHAVTDDAHTHTP